MEDESFAAINMLFPVSIKNGLHGNENEARKCMAMFGI
jgi:hypothetical protein